MIILIAFSFLAGIITILSPCILPILPIVLSGSFGSKRKPLGIVVGFVLSFTLFTLFLSALVKTTGISADALRILSIIIILIFGISLILPQFQVFMERLFSRLSGKFAVSGNHEGFHGGVFIGLSLGLVWTPCVGPIIASVITLAATSSVSFAAFFITLSYALGTAIPMFAIMLGGRGLLQKIPWLLPNTVKIQKAFGVIMILTAIGIFFNTDRKFQIFILDKFPSYGTGLTKIEDNNVVKNQINNIFNDSSKNSTNDNTKLGNYGKAPEIIPGGEWINSKPLQISDLSSKVILIDFWTYTCINCIRTLPYLKDWNEKYKDKGLVIIGVHSPEFEFEKNINNLKKAISDYEIIYPVVQDNDFATWSAYENRYWPAKYLIDKNGEIRYFHFGEGEYDTTEKVIQELLNDAGNELTDEINNDEQDIKYSELSHETYLGSGRMLYLHPNDKASNGEQSFILEKNIPKDKFTLGGKWIVSDEYSKSAKNSVLEYNFNASKVFLVMRSSDGNPKKIKVYLDGKLINSDQSGADTKNGIVTVDSDRLYDLINLDKIENHTLRLEFQDEGVEVFAFTFG